MTSPPEKDAIPVQDLSACCPEAQADGVPCTELGRSCDECERAVSRRDRSPHPEPAP